MSPSPEFYLSAYPSFILSGLLSPPSSSPSSLHSRDSFEFAPRRGSLPTDSTTQSYSSSADEGSMYYFTLQPRRDKNEYRSFLSLDLAEAQSLRSHSTRRKRSKYQSREPPFAVDFQIPDSPTLLPPRSPMRSRNSPSSSPRIVPSPKGPAPISSLPSVPPSPRSQTIEVSVSRTPTPVAIQAVPQRKASVVSHATRASATTSTVSTRYRRKRRNKALACLEGRRPAVPTPSPSANFMSMSEDEDEDDEDVQFERLPSPDMDADLLDMSLTDDQLIMLIARLDDGDLRSAPSPPRSDANSKASSRGSNGSTRTRGSSVQPSPRRRNKATLGLKSFMDFHNDEDSSRWSWRSFIEVAT
ncbi:hypothetical protein MSAN_00697200 [Mycena sanguinolenta]|uniref:Uncharacterized protein n=1 Tax=Mycena sanguinolenta TaxID=230812 RepID=A0A8H6Z4M1_9AGAR|nr:hypothetical protein MSAN_00697200 [Mycena sanguinolenta]